MAAIMAGNPLDWHQPREILQPVLISIWPRSMPGALFTGAGNTWRGRQCGLVCCGEMVYKKLGSKEMKTSTCSFVINIQSFSPAEPQRWCTSENNRTSKLSREMDWRWRWFRYFISEITERERWELMRSRSHQMARSPGLVTLRSTYSQIFSTSS